MHPSDRACAPRRPFEFQPYPIPSFKNTIGKNEILFIKVSLRGRFSAPLKAFDIRRSNRNIFAAVDDLLKLLKTNAHTPVEDLAKELNLSVAETQARIAKLENDGTILGYQVILDPDKAVGGSVTAVIEVKITPERGGGFDRLAARIAKFEQVQSCYLMSGGYDLLVIAEGRSLQEIATFIAEKLSTIKGVISTATHFRLKAYKENGVMLHREKREPRLAVSP
jgi:DNA-binding Lrp family transcriptional regulator